MPSSSEPCAVISHDEGQRKVGNIVEAMCEDEFIPYDRDHGASKEFVENNPSEDAASSKLSIRLPGSMAPTHCTAHTVIASRTVNDADDAAAAAANNATQSPILPIVSGDIRSLRSLRSEIQPMVLCGKDDAAKHTSTNIRTLSAYAATLAASNDPLKKRESIILLLGESLLKYGCPGHRAEDALVQMAQFFEMNCSFSLLPDTILATFHDSSTHRRSIMIKPTSTLDFGKIGEIQLVMNEFLRQRRYDDDDSWLSACIEALMAILTLPPTWGLKGTCFSYFISSCTACAMLFNGSWKDTLLSGILGLLVAGLTVLAGRRPIYGAVFEVSSSALVSAIARAFSRHCCFSTVALSSILILLPGYAMTIAVMELSARRVTSGTIRLIYAVFIAFILAYGFQIGSRVYTSVAAIFGIADASDDVDALCGKAPISPWFYIPLMPLLSLSIGMSYGSSIRQALPQFGGAIIAFCLCYFLAKIVPDMSIVSSTAAFAVGLYAHFVLKLSKEPPLISMAVGITLLVPGSVGVRAAFAVLREQDEQITSTSDILFPIRMLSISLGLAVGLFASAMVVYPAGKKGTLLLSL
ncbi:hypothetical protein BX666DRAFT_568940 [Dichotomocladium elegans]|nr:hypothetical protein BX666DRAFT_568940 [Dichotomocladium elegans]